MMKALTAFIYKLLACVAAILIMVEYTMTILEFYLVRALAMFLIPMFFLDVTKPFAQNLMRILISYFFKILTVILTCFFALGMFLDTQLFVMQYANDLSSSLTLIMYVSTIMMGVVFVMSSGKIAGVVLSGNPSMGVGDVVRMAHGTAHAMRTAGHTVQSAGRGIAKGHAMAQTGRRAAATVGAWQTAAKAEGDKAAAAIRASNAAGKTKVDEKGIDNAEKAAYRGVMAAAFKQAAGDAAYKFKYGKERPHTDEDGHLKTDRFFRVGEKAENQDQFGKGRGTGEASGDDVARKASAASSGIGLKAVKNAIKGNLREDGKKKMNDANTTAGHPMSVDDIANLYYGNQQKER